MRPVIPSRVAVVCVAVGEMPDVYVAKLLSMLGRQMPVAFDLTCLVDRPRALPAEVRTVDVSSWPHGEGIFPTCYKLLLFDPERVPLGEFLYLDTSLVIQKDLTPLLEFAFAQPQDLVTLPGLTYGNLNTAVMRIRQTERLVEIPRAFERGETFPMRIPGDQDYVAGVIRSRGWEAHVTRFPEEMVRSFIVARKLARREGIARGKAMLRDAIIVKFNGPPKMDVLIDPRRRLAKAVEKGNPWHRNAWFWVRETKRHWR